MKRLAAACVLLVAAVARAQAPAAPPPSSPTAPPSSAPPPGATAPPTSAPPPRATAPASSSAPSSSAPAVDAAALARRVDALAAQLGAAQATLEHQAAELTELRGAVAAARREGAVFRLGGFHVALFGFVQADGILYSQASADELNFSTGQPLNETRFLIRRARIRVDADYGPVAGALELDGNTINGPVARIIEAQASACWPRCATSDGPPLVMASLGLMRIPFGFEVQQKDYIRLFLERSNVSRALFPGEFDLGARLQGGWRWLRWQLAAMNGHPAFDKQFALQDPTQSKDFLGRLGVDTRLGGRVAVSGGLSGLYGTGFHAGTGSTKDTLVWRDTNGDGQVDSTEIFGVSGQPELPSQTFSRYAFGGDLQLATTLPRLGQLVVYGELMWATNLDRGLYVADPIAAGRNLRELGWYVGVTQELTKWAAVGVRYDSYNPDQDAREQVGANLVPRDKTFSTLAVVVAARLQRYARLSLEWDHNTNALGRDTSGAPATLGGEVVTLRGQVEF